MMFVNSSFFWTIFEQYNGYFWHNYIIVVVFDVGLSPQVFTDIEKRFLSRCSVSSNNFFQLPHHILITNATIVVIET